MSAYAHPVASVYINVYADVHNTCLKYTPAHAWCSQHLSKYMHTLRKNCTCTRACAPMQWCRSFFDTEAIANLPWVLREHPAGCRLPPALATRLAVLTNPLRPTLSAQEFCPNPRYLMTQSTLRCRTSINQSPSSTKLLFSQRFSRDF